MKLGHFVNTVTNLNQIEVIFTNPKHTTRQKYLPLFLVLIYFLNTLDLVFTFTYLKIGGFYEVNPLIRGMIHNPYLLLLLKLILPGLLLAYLITKAEEISKQEYKFFQLGIIILFIFYLLINIMHLCYLFLYFLM